MHDKQRCTKMTNKITSHQEDENTKEKPKLCENHLFK